MQGTRLSPEEKGDRRIRLLQAAWNLSQSQGLLAVRVSQVAKQGNVSIGTFYSHFPTKEDLIVQLASVSWEQRLQALHGSPRQSDIHTLLHIPLIELVYGARHAILLSAEQLATTPTIWSRSTDGSRLRMRHLHLRVQAFVRGSIEDALSRHLIEPDAQVDVLDHFIWMLSMGGAYVREASQRLEESEPSEVPGWFLEVLRVQLRGSGWIGDLNLEGALDEVMAQTMQTGIWKR